MVEDGGRLVAVFVFVDVDVGVLAPAFVVVVVFAPGVVVAAAFVVTGLVGAGGSTVFGAPVGVVPTLGRAVLCTAAFCAESRAATSRASTSHWFVVSRRAAGKAPSFTNWRMGCQSHGFVDASRDEWPLRQ